MAIASTPLVRRSSTTRCCSAAVPSAVILNSACTSASSSSAFSTPRRAIVQKSAELLVTNATLSVLAPPVALLSCDSHPTVATARQARDAISFALCLFISVYSSQRDRSSAERHDARRRSRKDVRPVSSLLFVCIRHARDRGRGTTASEHGDSTAAAAAGDPRAI